MDDNDEEGAYDRDFYGNLPEGGEEPPLPPFRTFSFQADPAGGPGSSTGQQPTQADGTLQDPEPEPDDVNNDTGPVLGGDEDLNEEEGEEEEEDGQEDGEKNEANDEENDDENDDEEKPLTEAQAAAVARIRQEWVDRAKRIAQDHGDHTGQEPAREHLLQQAAHNPAPTPEERSEQLLTARVEARCETQAERIALWLTNSSHIDRPGPQEAGQDAMTKRQWAQRYRNMTPAERLAFDIPTPPGEPDVANRNTQSYWSQPWREKKQAKSKPKPKTRGQGKRKGKRGADDDNDDDRGDGSGGDDDMSYIPGQAYLAEDNLPWRMGFIEMVHKEFEETDKKKKAPQVGQLRDRNGNIVMGRNGPALRDLPILPQYIPANVPGWLVETWRRYDSRVKGTDIEHRMPKGTTNRQQLKPADDWSAKTGMLCQNQRNYKPKLRKVGSDFINASKKDVLAAQFLDPSESNSSEREITRQRIFRNTIWEFLRNDSGRITGIRQPGGISGHVFPLPPTFQHTADRVRAGSAKRHQLATYSQISDAGAPDWLNFAKKDPVTYWGHNKNQEKRKATIARRRAEAAGSANDSRPSTPASGEIAAAQKKPARKGRVKKTAEASSTASSAAKNAKTAPSATKNSNAADNPDGTDPDELPWAKPGEIKAPNWSKICFGFFENHEIHSLELEALLLLRPHAAHGFPAFVNRQLDQFLQERRNRDARAQEQEARLQPAQILDTVEEAVRMGREAIDMHLVHSRYWQQQHRILHQDPDSNRVLVFQSAIILLMVLRNHINDPGLLSGFDPDEPGLMAIYGGDDNQGDRETFVEQVTRNWRVYFPEEEPFNPESINQSDAAEGSRPRSGPGSHGQQRPPLRTGQLGPPSLGRTRISTRQQPRWNFNPLSPSAYRPQQRPETGPPNQPDDDGDDDDDEDEDDDYPDNGLTVTERLDLEDAEKRKKQQHTQNTAQQNPAPTPTPNMTNNQPGLNQQHGQEDTTPKPSTGDTPRRSSRRASAAATAAIQQQISPTRPTRSNQQQRLSDSEIHPTLRNLGFGEPQPSPGGGARGPMSPPPRPTAINTSPRTPNGRGQAPTNAPHTPSPRRSPRFQRTSQGSAQHQPQMPVETRTAVNMGGWEDENAYPGDDLYYGPPGNSPNTAGEFMDQLAQANGPTVYPSPPSARNTRNNPYFFSPQNRPHAQQQHHAPFTPYGHNNHDPLAYLYNQGQTLQHDQLLHQPQMPGARNSMDGIAQRIVTEVGGWNMNQRQLAQQQQQYQQYQQQQLAEQQQQQGQLQPPASPRNQLGIIGQYSNQIRQLNQQQGLVWPQQPPAAAHAPPFLPSVQQPTAQAPLGAPFEATAPTAQAPPAQAPQPDPEPESESEPEPQPQRKKPAAKKTGGGARGKKRKASEDPTDEASTTQQQPPTKTTKKAATTKATTKTRGTTAPPTRKRGGAQTPAAAAAPSGPSTRRQTRAQSAAIAEAAAAGDDGGADGGGSAGDDDKEADDAQATTKRVPVKRKRGGGAAAKAPPGRLQKTRNAVKKGRVSGLHEVYDNPQKPDGGKESMQPGKKRKVMGAEKEEDDDMRDRDDDDDGGDSDYTED